MHPANNWQPIDTAPIGREIFVARGFGVPVGTPYPYDTDPYCVWQERPGEFVRWPHRFAPTHWLRLPEKA